MRWDRPGVETKQGCGMTTAMRSPLPAPGQLLLQRSGAGGPNTGPTGGRVSLISRLGRRLTQHAQMLSRYTFVISSQEYSDISETDSLGSSRNKYDADPSCTIPKPRDLCCGHHTPLSILQPRSCTQAQTSHRRPQLTRPARQRQSGQPCSAAAHKHLLQYLAPRLSTAC